MRVSQSPDANRLPGVTDRGLRISDRDNVILAGKSPEPQGSTWTHVVAQGLDRPGVLNRRPSGGAPAWERAA